MSRKVSGAGATAALVIALVVIWIVHPKKTIETARNPAPATVAAPTDPLHARMDDIVTRYRETIVLLEDDSPSDTGREDASLVGRIIFQENHQALTTLSDDLTSSILSAGDWSQSPASVSHFLDLVETQADLHDADKLVFRETFTEIADSLSGLKTAVPAKRELEQRVER